MKIIKKSSTEFSEILKSTSQKTSNSFFDNSNNLSENQLKVLSKCIGENITYSYRLSSRKLSVSFTDPHTFNIKTTENENSETALFDLYLVQSATRMYLVVASKFDVYKFIKSDPYHESLGEYSYQTQLAQALGLINAVAYNVPRNYEVTEKIITDDDLELMHCSDDELFFIMYCL